MSLALQPRFPGTIQARAFYDESGEPKMEIEREEILRLRHVLLEQLGYEPTLLELFEYVYKATLH